MPDRVGHDGAGARNSGGRPQKQPKSRMVGGSDEGDSRSTSGMTRMGVLQETADERFIVSTNFMYICRLFGEMSRLSTSTRHDKATQNYDQTQIHTRRYF